MAMGGDQAGSIRIPASHCGIVGLKPTFGLVPYTGIGLLSKAVCDISACRRQPYQPTGSVHTRKRS